MEYNGKKILAKPNGNTYDIIEALINITPQAIEQVKPKINTLVKLTGNAYVDAKTIAKFVRDNVTYKADGYDSQNIQLPGRLVNGTKLGDCKSFSLLFVSMMKAAGHKAGYRFASYRKNKIPTHVYNWVLDNDKNFYTFDTCVKTLKESPRHTYIKDMDVNYLTGSPENDSISGRAERQARRDARKEKRTERREDRKEKREDRRAKGKGVFQKVKKIALAAPRNAFRLIVSMNVRGLAKNLNQAILKDSSKVKGFWEKLGGKFDGKNSLTQSINTGKDKRPVFGEKGVNGFDDNEPYIGIALEAAVASAAPILLAVRNLLKDLGIKPEDIQGLISPTEEQEATESGNKFDDANFVPSDPEEGAPTPSGLSTGFSVSPLIIGGVLGAGVLIYLLTKKKK
jgi:hypothetical protein